MRPFIWKGTRKAYKGAMISGGGGTKGRDGDLRWRGDSRNIVVIRRVRGP